MERRTGSEDGDIDDSLEPESKMEEEMGLEGSGEMTIEENVANRITSVAQMTTKEDLDRELLQVEAEFDKQIRKSFSIVSLIGHHTLKKFCGHFYCIYIYCICILIDISTISNPTSKDISTFHPNR